MKKHLFQSLKLLPIFIVAAQITFLTADEDYWNSNAITRLILGFPVLFILVYNMFLLDSVYVLFFREKAIVVDILKSIEVCKISLGRITIIFDRIFYLTDIKNEEKVLSTLVINKNFGREKECLYLYKSSFGKDKNVFNLILLLLLLIKLFLMYVVYYSLEFLLGILFSIQF